MNKIAIICVIVIISAVAVPHTTEAREMRPHSTSGHSGASGASNNLLSLQNLQYLQNNIPVIGRLTNYMSDKLVEHLKSVRLSVGTESANADLVDTLDRAIGNVQAITGEVTKLLQAEEIHQARPQQRGF